MIGGPKEISFIVSDPEYMDFASAKLLEYSGTERIFLFEGEMGSGKTTLIKSLCKKLQVTDTTSSPTYNIINEYLTITGEKIYHFDLFRIKSPSELNDLGYEDYIHSGCFCFIEWPEKAGNFLPDSFVKISILVNEEYRTIVASKKLTESSSM